MQGKRKTVKSMSCHGFSQFELTDKLLKNVYKLGLKGVTKDVLIQLSTFYNPKNRTMFPKQKTLAQRVNASERSVIRAIQSLVKAGLILVECKHTNHYIFTSKLYNELGLNEKIFTSEKLSHNKRQNDTLKGDILSPHVKEQTKEHKKEPTKVDDFKILKEYAENKGAKNTTAYINALKKNGSADKIIADFKAKEAADKYFARQIKETQEMIARNKKDAETAVPPTAEWNRLKAQAKEIIKNGKIYNA